MAIEWNQIYGHMIKRQNYFSKSNGYTHRIYGGGPKIGIPQRKSSMDDHDFVSKARPGDPLEEPPHRSFQAAVVRNTFQGSIDGTPRPGCADGRKVHRC